MMANLLQKLVRQEIERKEIEISEQRLMKLNMNFKTVNIIDYVTSTFDFVDPLIEKETKEMEEKALLLAYSKLNSLEIEILTNSRFTYKKASMLTGIPTSTIRKRIKTKINEIRNECFISC